MFRKLVPLVIVSLWGVVILPLPQQANASTPLTRAVVKKLHNWVQLLPQNRPKRRARTRDTMIPGDGLATGKSSLADLRFNDGSLARIGERAVFRFAPRTRTFRLLNGTVLLLIPPGQGQTKIRTRSAGATIRGSALFVRYDEQTDTTVVGSLTDSGIEVFNKDESRSQVLKAGQLIVVVKGKIQGLYDFDLRSFYETSDLVRGLDLSSTSDTASDPAMASVQAETSEAVSKQVPIKGEDVVENPSFIELSPVSSETPGEEVVPNPLPANPFVEDGPVIIDNSEENEDNPSLPITPIIPATPTPTDTGKPTTPAIPATPITPPTGSGTPTKPTTPTTPPTDNGTPTKPTTPTTPPTGGGTPTKPTTPTTPPTDNGTPTKPTTPTTPPTDNGTPTKPTTPTTPPTDNGTPTKPTTPTTPPTDNGTPTKPTTETPPIETPPIETPPIETPPIETPPIETPPIETPPIETPPIETPPIETPPIETPPIETPPIETPPIETPPIETPPIETPPIETPPIETPPIETPPIENPTTEPPPIST